MRSRARRRARGITLIEVMVAAGIGATMLLAASELARASMRDSAALACRSALADKSANAADAIARELQVAGIRGEDANGNGITDLAEDENRNGRLDADWNLADGASAGSITFNAVRQGWDWTGPVTYAVTGGVLQRTEGGDVRDVCRNVTGFAISRTRNIVDVTLTLSARDSEGNWWTETARRRVHVRN